MSIAILNWCVWEDIMARLAHVEITSTVKKCYGAAVHAFPIDLSFSMNFAICGADTHLLDNAFLAKKVFLGRLSIMGIRSFLLTVD